MLLHVQFFGGSSENIEVFVTFCFVFLLWRANKRIAFLEIYVLAMNIFDKDFIDKFE